MERETVSKKRFNFATYATVVAFLCLEVFAFISFSLGQSFILYGSLLIVLTICLLIVVFREIKVDGLSTYAFFLFPIFVFGLLSALSPFVKESYGSIGIANAVFIPITLTFAGAAGFFVGHIKGFDLQKLFLVIYGALAVLVLINFVLTMIYYVPFYSLIYRNSYIYYNGQLLQTFEDSAYGNDIAIGQTAYMLFGFEAIEVSLVYWSLFPMILCTSGIALFYIKYKENRKLFLTYLAFVILGALSLLFTISKYTLLGDLVLIFTMGLLITFLKVKKSRKIIKYGLITLLILFVIGFILVFLNAQTWSFVKGLKDVIASNTLLNRIFNTNYYMARINSVLWELFNKGKIFGSFVGGVIGGGYGVYQRPTGSWFFDNFLTSGIFGALFFAFALVIGIRQMIRYYKKEEEHEVNKALLFAYVLGVFAITGVSYCAIPIINANNLYPVYMFSPLIIAIFLISYCFKPLGKQSNNQNQENKEVPEHEEVSI